MLVPCSVCPFSLIVPTLVYPHQYAILWQENNTNQDPNRMVRFVPFVMALVTLVVTAGANVRSPKSERVSMSVQQAQACVVGLLLVTEYTDYSRRFDPWLISGDDRHPRFPLYVGQSPRYTICSPCAGARFPRPKRAAWRSYARAWGLVRKQPTPVFNPDKLSIT